MLHDCMLAVNFQFNVTIVTNCNRYIQKLCVNYVSFVYIARSSDVLALNDMLLLVDRLCGCFDVYERHLHITFY